MEFTYQISYRYWVDIEELDDYMKPAPHMIAPNSTAFPIYSLFLPRNHITHIDTKVPLDVCSDLCRHGDWMTSNSTNYSSIPMSFCCLWFFLCVKTYKFDHCTIFWYTFCTLVSRGMYIQSALLELTPCFKPFTIWFILKLKTFDNCGLLQSITEMLHVN